MNGDGGKTENEKREGGPWCVPELAGSLTGLEQSMTREKFGRVLNASFLRSKFCRALNTSFLIDVGAPRLRRSVSPNSLPPLGRTATLLYL